MSNNNENHENFDHASKGRRNAVVSAVLGAVGGAVIVGAVWGIMASQGGSNDAKVATVGNTAIHRSDFVSQMESQSGQQTLATMIEDDLIKQGATAQKITASQSDVNNALQNLEAQYRISGSTQLQMFLAQNNLTQAQLNEILKTQVLEQKMSEKGITVSDKEITDYYNAHKAQFTPQGSKTPEPLSKVRSQVISDVKASKATSPTVLLANLAKKFPITIYDKSYTSVKDQIEKPASSSPSSNAASSNSAGGQ